MGVKPDSKRYLALKYEFSDKEIMYEIARRIEEGERDTWLKYVMLRRELVTIAKKVLGR